MRFQTGSLVRARGRDWVVLPPLAAEMPVEQTGQAASTGQGAVPVASAAVPDSDEWLLLRPLGGIDEEIVEICPELEPVASASFAPPDPTRPGDARSCGLLRDAVRLGLRSTTGPFRSFGHIAVDPRPYQLVPLLLALKQPVIRLLIADDVGIGKTVEALLIARELLDRGEIRRLSILCPPQLAEQWQHELADKFHLEAELVLPSTVNRLERHLDTGTSLFEKYPFTIVSLDYIKSERHRLDFIRTCPELVIVDEAHTCASAGGSTRRQQRYELVSRLSKDPARHMILVTATPHSGKEDAFRDLLSFLSPELDGLPADLSGREHEKDRRRLAEYFIQRRRGDIRSYMDANTPFPERKSQERTWSANPGWTSLFNRSLALARANISASEASGNVWQKHISWWSALALLRAVSSSPAAAAQTLRARAPGSDEEERDVATLDAAARQGVFDLDSGDDANDTLPGADASFSAASPCANPAAGPSAAPAASPTTGQSVSLPGTPSAHSPGTPAGEGRPAVGKSAGCAAGNAASSANGTARPSRDRYTELARLAESLYGENDAKLQGLLPELKKLLQDGFSPVIFCRFIATAEYLVTQLRPVFKEWTIESVTGLLPPAEREGRVAALAAQDRRILVCTDCLSEGINLQESFNAVIHYDLSWNPTRHEQREGRVDRFGQSMKEVRTITWWGRDNPMDGMVLEVLLRKHEAIRRTLGISVPVPEESENIMETLLQGLLLRKGGGGAGSILPGGKKGAKTRQLVLPGVEDAVSQEKLRVAEEWDAVASKEMKRSQTFFAQQSIRAEEVAALQAANTEACGDAGTVENFMAAALAVMTGNTIRPVERDGQRVYDFAISKNTRTKFAGVDLPESDRKYVFSLPVKKGQVCLTRTHPMVEGLAAWLAENALDSVGETLLPRCGAMRTTAVDRRTTLLLCRFRFRIGTRGDVMKDSLAEECVTLAFRGAPEKAEWLEPDCVPALLGAEPTANMTTEQAVTLLQRVVPGLPALHGHIEDIRRKRGEVLLEWHRKVRDASRRRNLRYEVQAQGEPDILGVFVYLPDVKL